MGGGIGLKDVWKSDPFQPYHPREYHADSLNIKASKQVEIRLIRYRDTNKLELSMRLGIKVTAIELGMRE